MGNSSSSGSSPVSATDLLQLIAQEEAETGATAPVCDGPAPNESEVSSQLSSLGVEMGEASVPGTVKKRDGGRERESGCQVVILS